MGACMKNKWVSIDKSGGAPVVKKAVRIVQKRPRALGVALCVDYAIQFKVVAVCVG